MSHSGKPCGIGSATEDQISLDSKIETEEGETGHPNHDRFIHNQVIRIRNAKWLFGSREVERVRGRRAAGNYGMERFSVSYGRKPFFP